MVDRFSSGSIQSASVEVPLFYLHPGACPQELRKTFDSLYSEHTGIVAVPTPLDLQRRTAADVLKEVHELTGRGDCPLMLFEWQWEPAMLDLMSFVSRRNQRSLFIKPGSGERVKNVHVLIGGGRQSFQNLRIAWKIARHFKASIKAFRVVDPEWVKLDENRVRADYSYRYQTTMQKNLRRMGLPIPVHVIHQANAIDRLIHQAHPSDLLVLGCPNDYVIRHSFGESHAGQALRHSAGPVVAISRGAEAEVVNLNDVLWEATILCDLQAGSKWQAMEEMVDSLIDAGQLPDGQRNGVLTDLFKREAEASTYVGNGVAVPHAGIKDCADLIGCLAISREGIPYDSHEEPVNFIFLLITSRRDYTKYLKVQASIARFMKRGAIEHRQRILACRSAAEVVQVLQAELEPAGHEAVYSF